MNPLVQEFPLPTPFVYKIVKIMIQRIEAQYAEVMEEILTYYMELQAKIPNKYVYIRFVMPA